MSANELEDILLVEDNSKDLELTLTALKKNHITNRVVVVRDGDAAFDYLYRDGDFAHRGGRNPGLILLDLRMPKVDGLEVLRRIKSDAKLKMIPVIVMSSSRAESDLVASYRLGVNAYVVKPVHFAEFVEAVGRLGMFWALVNEPPPDSADA